MNFQPPNDDFENQAEASEEFVLSDPEVRESIKRFARRKAEQMSAPLAWATLPDGKDPIEHFIRMPARQEFHAIFGGSQVFTAHAVTSRREQIATAADVDKAVSCSPDRHINHLNELQDCVATPNIFECFPNFSTWYDA